MCILGLVDHIDNEIPFVLAHSRDEHLSRATSPFEWQDGLLFARDEQRGGTFLCYGAEVGVLAALVNVRFKHTAFAYASRGDIVLRAARGEFTPAALAAENAVIDLGQPYGSFAMVVSFLGVGLIESFYLTNVSGLSSGVPNMLAGGAQASVARIGPGAHALSNSFIDDCSWPKVRFVQSGIDGLREAPTNGAEALATSQPTCIEASALESSYLRVLGGAAEVLGHERCLDLSSMDLSWSPLNPSFEAFLQGHVRVPRRVDLNCGARSLVVVVVVAGCVRIAHRTYDYVEGEDSWSFFQIPRPRTTALSSSSIDPVDEVKTAELGNDAP